MSYIQIQWSCAALDEAKRIAGALLSQRLIACAQIDPAIVSIYSWKGALTESSEVKVLLKTQLKHWHTVRAYISAHASYELPEITYLSIQGDPPYLRWIEEMTS